MASLALAAAASCSSSKFDGTSFHVYVDDSIVLNPTSGNNFSVLLEDESGHCPLSTSSTFTLGVQTVPFSDCTAVVGPFSGNPSFTLRAADGDDRAEMVVSDLVPGADAMVTVPANGQVAPGANLTVSVPAALQGQSPVVAEFAEAPPLDGYDRADSFPVLPYLGASVQSSFDVPAPQHPATYTFIVLMEATADAPAPLGQVVSCTGFAQCSATAAPALGPMTITVTP